MHPWKHSGAKRSKKSSPIARNDMKPYYPLFRVHVDTFKASNEINEVLRSGFINEGTQVTKLSHALQEKLEVNNLTLVNSCTSALTLALKLAGVTASDTVVSTPMTCVATNTPIVALGAKIRWADVNPAYGMVTPRTVEDAIENRYGDDKTKPKAVMVVAWAGSPPMLHDIRRVCDKHNVKLILDAAHAFGAKYDDFPVHHFAHYTCYSFQAIKHFTTGDGGALICEDIDDHNRAKALKWFGLDRDRAKDEKGEWKGQQWDVDITESGFKYNMNNMAAALGLSQVPHIDDILAKHRRNAKLYDEQFAACKTVVPTHRIKNSESSHWVYSMCTTNSSRLSRDELLKVLNDEWIMA
jgi:perosamine synthetase